MRHRRCIGLARSSLGTLRACVVDGALATLLLAGCASSPEPSTRIGHVVLLRLVDPADATRVGQVWLERHLWPFVHAETGKASRDPSDFSYGLAFPVLGGGRVLGAVLALKRWDRIQAELDARTDGLRGRYPSATAMMVPSVAMAMVSQTGRSSSGM